MMMLSEQEFRRERLYAATMVLVKRMLREQLITHSEYWLINRKMKEKYHPVTDGLISELDVISGRVPV